MRDGPTTIVWFRNDLRVHDHPALCAGVARGPVVLCFVLDEEILGRRHHDSPSRLRLLRAGLAALDDDLRARGSGLVVRRGRPDEILPALAAEAGADLVVCSRGVTPLATASETRVARALGVVGAALSRHPGGLVVEPEALPGPAGSGYLVFTPFFRAWSAAPGRAALPAPRAIAGPVLASEGLDRLPAGAPPGSMDPGGARDALEAFVATGGADDYARRRDMVAQEGTSRLSGHLRLGMLSGPQVIAALERRASSEGGEEFRRQLAWRDFFHHLLLHHPHAARRAFRPALARVAWDRDDAAFERWRGGETGYPLVDAGMRQLATDGWMHNRARLVTASFLVKDLLIDWRRGETHFMRELADGDPASNNGGWQWVAGTGTDAAPYFRVLNPTLQARRFDPEGAYIRRHLPELRSVPDRRIHEPWLMSPEEQRAAGCRIGRDYPAPIVDHALRRGLALDRYRAALGATGATTE